MLDRFKTHLHESGLIPPESKLLVGYSGGPDSTALLVLLVESGFDCVAAHLHHGMRPEADRELDQCAAFADSLGIPFLSGRADIPAMSAKLRIGVEEAGRHARRAFFQQSAGQTGCSLIATGHTQDDHVETVLMNLARGAGMSGLGGIRPLRDGFVRPLLPFTRDETRMFCKERGLWFHDDPGNFDESFTRVKVRKRIIPEFEAVNPKFKSAVSRVAETLAEEDTFLQHMAANLIQTAEIPLNGNLSFLTDQVEACFDRQALADAPSVLARRGIRLAAAFIGGELGYENTLAILNSIRQPGSSISVTAGQAVIELSQSRLMIRNLQEIEPFRFPLTVPGVTESEVFGWKFTTLPAPSDGYQREPGSLDAVIDMESAKGGLYFRSAQPGDQMVPLGGDSPRKVSDLLAKSKLTSAARRRLPIIYDMAGPIWIPGCRLADRVRVTDKTVRAISVRFGPL